MALEAKTLTNFEVNFTGKSLVKATVQSPETHILTLSNLDLLSGRFPITYFFFYATPQDQNFTTIIDSIKSSLAQTLTIFFPFAGRIVQNPKTNEPQIICDNTGALLEEAHTNIPLKELNFYNLDQFLKAKLVPIDNDFPLQIQVTFFVCGGLLITFTFDHALGDASSFGKFLLTLSQIATKKAVTCIPDHTRYIRARIPSTYNKSLDESFVACTLEEIINIPTTNILLKRLYYIDAMSIDRLKMLACKDGVKRTKIEAFSAYLWKIMASVVDKSHENCKMGWLVDGRNRIFPNNQNFKNNYIGNVLSLTFAESNVVALKNGSVSDIASMVHEAILHATNEAHFLDLIDWIECHRPGLVLSKMVLGRGGATLVVSSGRRFPVGELDFGFGNPVLGTVCTTIEKIGVGYVNQRESAKGDGSWIVSAILWPQLVDALENDCEHVFKPMDVKYLQP